MSHEITIRRNGTVEMAYTGATPWHGLGAKLTVGAPIEDWIASAGMNWRIKRAKVRYPLSPDAANDPAQWGTMDDRHVLLRSDNGAPLGIVSDNYKVVQPAHVLEFFRDLTDAAGFTLETAGTLFGGKRMWALAHIGATAAIADDADKVKGYLLLSTACDGTMATEARYTTVRVVCNNTLSASRSGDAKVKVTHRTQFDHDSVKRELGIGAAQESFANTMAMFRELATTRVTPLDVVSATGRLLVPEFNTMSTEDQEKALKASKPVHRIGVLALDNKAMGGALDGVKGTAWGWLNAVTQYVDHEARTRGDNAQDNRLSSAWFGKGAHVKQQALDIAMAMADGSYRYQPTHRAMGNNTGLLDAVLDNTTC